jgi:quercetin dioxygenase-like cupin family protein
MRVRTGTWVCASLVVAAAIALTAAAQETGKPQAVERATLGRHDLSGVPGKEVVMGTATLAPGAVVGFHTHSGDEAGYVVEGSLIWKVRGQPDKTLKAGDSFFNPRGSVHSVVGGEGGGTAFSTWIVDKGKPLAEPVNHQ